MKLIGFSCLFSYCLSRRHSAITLLTIIFKQEQKRYSVLLLTPCMLLQNLPISSLQEVLALLGPAFEELYRLFRTVYYWLGFDAESFTVFLLISRHLRICGYKLKCCGRDRRYSGKRIEYKLY